MSLAICFSSSCAGAARNGEAHALGTSCTDSRVPNLREAAVFAEAFEIGRVSLDEQARPPIAYSVALLDTVQCAKLHKGATG